MFQVFLSNVILTFLKKTFLIISNEYNLCYYGTLGYNDAIGCKFKRLGLSCFSNYNNYEYKVDRLVNLAYSKDSQQLLF
jgi:hypothetical protein